MHLVFTCAERWCLIEMGKNPIALVRAVKDCTKRLKRPRVLTVEPVLRGMLPHLRTTLQDDGDRSADMPGAQSQRDCYWL